MSGDFQDEIECPRKSTARPGMLCEMPHENRRRGVLQEEVRRARRHQLDPERAQIVVTSELHRGVTRKPVWALDDDHPHAIARDPVERRLEARALADGGPLPTPRPHRTRQRSRTRGRRPLPLVRVLVGRQGPARVSCAVCNQLRGTRRLNVGLLFQRLALVLSGPCNGCPVGKPETNA